MKSTRGANGARVIPKSEADEGGRPIELTLALRIVDLGQQLGDVFAGEPLDGFASAVGQNRALIDAHSPVFSFVSAQRVQCGAILPGRLGGLLGLAGGMRVIRVLLICGLYFVPIFVPTGHHRKMRDRLSQSADTERSQVFRHFPNWA
jgi:hypothetical protein